MSGCVSTTSACTTLGCTNPAIPSKHLCPACNLRLESLYPVWATPEKAREVFNALKADLDARDHIGWVQYGRPLLIEDGRDTLRDAFEEALDLVVYLKKLMMERDRAHGRNDGPPTL